MKNLFTFLAAILCSVGAFGQGAQYRPTPYANGFVQTVTSTGTAQTYLGIGSSTNNALLNGTNVFTGTNTFTPAGFFPANGIKYRLLYYTNLLLSSVVYATNSTSPGFPTNAGEIVHATTIASITMPALTSPRSLLQYELALSRTNTQTAGTSLYVYAGTNTNCVAYVANYYGNGTSLPSVFGGLGLRSIFVNNGSLTNQTLIPTSFTVQTNWTGSYVVDTSQEWNLRFALAATGSGYPNTNTYVELSVLETLR